MRSRVVLAVVAVLLAPTTSPTSSGAQASGDTGYDDGYVFAGYEDHPVSVTQVVSRPRNPTRWCVHWSLALGAAMGDIDSLTPEQVRQLSREYRGPLVDESFYVLICYRTDELTPYRVRVVQYRRRDPTAGTITTIEDVGVFARDLVTAPAPAVSTSPPPDRLVVGFETWLATPEPHDAPVRIAQAGHLWARAEPVPVAITYEMGDATVIRCDGPPPVAPPGVHDDERPGCARHTYLNSWADDGIGTFTVRATVTYDVWLTTSEDPTPRAVDTIDGPTTELPVTVREIQALIK
jgi:hypothetical protein